MTDEAAFSKDTATKHRQYKVFFRETCKLKPSTTEMNQQNQNYYISSQFPELNFQAFLLSHCVSLQGQRGPQQTGGTRNGTRLRDKSLNCQKLRVASTEADLVPPQRYKIISTRNSTRILRQAIPWKQHSIKKEVAKWERKCLNSSLKLTGDTWNIVLSQMGKLHQFRSSAEKGTEIIQNLRTNQLLSFCLSLSPVLCLGQWQSESIAHSEHYSGSKLFHTQRLQYFN